MHRCPRKPSLDGPCCPQKARQASADSGSGGGGGGHDSRATAQLYTLGGPRRPGHVTRTAGPAGHHVTCAAGMAALTSTGPDRSWDSAVRPGSELTAPLTTGIAAGLSPRGRRGWCHPSPSPPPPDCGGRHARDLWESRVRVQRLPVSVSPLAGPNFLHQLTALLRPSFNALDSRAGKSSFSGPKLNLTVGKWLPIASHVKCFRQEPRSRHLALTASLVSTFYQSCLIRQIRPARADSPPLP